MATKAVFLDRDGVINRNPGEGTYVKRPDEFVLNSGVVEAVRDLLGHGFEVFVVSNQSGIARGLVQPVDLDAITERMLQSFKKGHAPLSGVFYCKHDDADKCHCRKPKSGLYEDASKGRSIDRTKSFSIGDSERDIEAGKRYGCRSLLVLSGKSKSTDVTKFCTAPEGVFEDLPEAVHWIINQSS